MTTIDRKQPMRPAEIDLLNQVDANTADIATQTARLTQEIADRTNGDNVLQSKLTQEIADRTNGDNVLQSKLTQEIADRTNGDNVLQSNIDAEASARADADATLQQSVPAQEFGTSNAIDVQANSNTSIDINFGSTKTEVPIILCSLQHASDNISYIVTEVTNQQFSVTVYNHSSTDVSGITIDWLAISGR